MRFFNPGPISQGKSLMGQRMDFSTVGGTGATRRVLGADGTVAAIIRAKSAGSYGGRMGNTVYTVLQRINATPRYLLQFFNPRGTQIGSNILENGTSLNGLASTLASNANGAFFELQVIDNANEATEDTGNGFANSTPLQGGA
jgi:hypothetical protein